MNKDLTQTHPVGGLWRDNLGSLYRVKEHRQSADGRTVLMERIHKAPLALDYLTVLRWMPPDHLDRWAERVQPRTRRRSTE